MNSILKAAHKISSFKSLLNPVKNVVSFNTANVQRQAARTLWYMSTNKPSTLGLKIHSMSDTCSCGCGGRGAHSKGKYCVFEDCRHRFFILKAAQKELVEFLTEEILAERKVQKSKTIPTELDGFKAKLDGAEVTLTKEVDNETYCSACFYSVCGDVCFLFVG